jgi:copper chaperone CopZ
MKKIFVIIAMLVSIASYAQVKKVTLQASGLTCSMCSNAINKSLQSLDFVDKVYANIKNSSFDILFKPGTTVDFDKIKNKVESAGFFVAKFSAQVQFNNANIANDQHVQQDGFTYHFLNVGNQLLNGEKTLQIIDKGFVPAKQYKKNSKFTNMQCYHTGIAEACCSKDNIAKGTRIYHVTI